MEFKNGTRWGLGTRSARSRTPGIEESQRLLLDSDDQNQNEDFFNSSRAKGKQNKGVKVRKAKLEDSYSEDDEDNLLPLGALSRPPKPLPVPDQCIEVDIQPGETLTSVSLKYNIPLAEVKRVNKLLTDNEFYARKRIKIPFKPASLLTELLPSQTQGANNGGNGWIIRRAGTPDPTETGATSSTVPSSPNSEAEGCAGGLDEETGLAPLHVSHVNQPSEGIIGSSSKNFKKAKVFLKNVDKDLKRIKEKQDAMNVKTGNGKNDFVPVPLEVEDSEQTNQRSSATTCGVVFIVLIVLAVFIILLIAKHETFELEEQHHWNHSEAHHEKRNH